MRALAFVIALVAVIAIAAVAEPAAGSGSPRPSASPSPEPTAAGAPAPPAPAAAAHPDRSITVTGIGFAPVTTTPKKVFAVYASVDLKGSDPAPAKAALDAKLAELRAALEKAGIAPKDVIQLQASVNVRTDGWNGWGALQVVANTEKDLEAALAAARGAGAAQIDTAMPYRSPRTEVAPVDAVVSATDEARAHARALAEGIVASTDAVGEVRSMVVSTPKIECCPQLWRVEVTVTFERR